MCLCVCVFPCVRACVHVCVFRGGVPRPSPPGPVLRGGAGLLPAGRGGAGLHRPAVRGLERRAGPLQPRLAGRRQRALPHPHPQGALRGTPGRGEDPVSLHQPNRLPRALCPPRRLLLPRSAFPPVSKYCLVRCQVKGRGNYYDFDLQTIYFCIFLKRFVEEQLDTYFCLDILCIF